MHQSLDPRPIGSIVIGDRVRRSPGDLDALCDSLARLGMLHPVVITTDGRLVCGFRRLKAAEKLGWQTVPVRVVRKLSDALLALTAEQDENVCREPFTPTEAVEVARRIREIEAPKAKERQAAAGPKEGRGAKRQATGSPKLGEPVARGRTDDLAAKATGYGRESLRKAEKVVEAAEKEPEKYAPVAAEMDRTGKVEPAYRKLVDPDKVAVKKPQRVETDLSGPARARLIQTLEAISVQVQSLTDAVAKLRAEKIDPHQLPGVFAAFRDKFRAIADQFGGLAETPIEDLSAEVLHRLAKEVQRRVNDEDGDGKLLVKANMEILRKLISRPPADA